MRDVGDALILLGALVTCLAVLLGVAVRRWRAFLNREQRFKRQGMA